MADHTQAPAPAAVGHPGDCNIGRAPHRYIYNQADMEHFRHSPARKELLSFVSAMGRGLAKAGNPSPLPHGGYRPRYPLENLTPALASLHGSLSCMSKTWMDPNHDGIPTDHKVKARFGNPAFRTWHARLSARSYGIVRCLMGCHVKYSSHEVMTKGQILKECSDHGYRAASSEGPSLWQRKKLCAESRSDQEEMIRELQAYLHDSFGHPVRLDYGTGHESSFVVLLLSLCKIGCFRWAGPNSNNSTDVTGGENKKESNSSPEVISVVSLSLFHAYLNVTRGLQQDYMLEPAGSHGVWGLDDYHCVPFYLGACQMMAREEWQQYKQHLNKESVIVKETDPEDEVEIRNSHKPYLLETSFPQNEDSAPSDYWSPSIIRNRQIVETHHPTYLYLSCVHFIQQIKPNVPFFESSPMLNDISHLGNWSKVSSGLLRLYEGEVLDKMPVVQHFVFGKIFSANWFPSRKAPLEAPKRMFISGPVGDDCAAPWAYGDGSGRGVDH